ncbi:MAG: hypothetical protein PHN45_04995 [Methylococcales bacterium]|nr:hypothetical protein [Methylococcales bacterium]MDD5754093.1 hypothetical protein [Methylococcales bacterium]
MLNNYIFDSLFDFNSLFNFNPFNPFFHKKNAPSTTTTGTDVNIGVNQSYTVKTNGLSIHGNTGYEKVTVAQNVSGIKIDSTVDSVTLSGIKFDPSALVSTTGTLAINSAAGNLATLSVAANHNEALNFSNAVGTLSLDNSGNGVFNLSQIQLDKNQSFTVTNNDLQVYGNSGQEKITLTHGVTGIEVSSTVETVILDGKSSDFSYDVEGDTVVISDTSGNDVAFVSVNTASTGSQIQFSDKTLSASWEITGSFGRWNSWGVIVTDPTTPSIPTTISGGTNFSYSVDFSQANLGSNLANVETDIKTALDNIGQYVSSKTTFNLQVLTEQTSPKTLAEANATMVNTITPNGAAQTTTFLADSISGTDSNGVTPDSTLYINLANLSQMSFSGTPIAEKYDLTSILTHEILHGMAFTGNLGTTDGLKTPYDALVSMQNNSPVFTGSYAETANGNAPVPLDSASAGDGSAYYHVAVANDLMADSLGKGEVRTISELDVSMLHDMGVSIIGVSPTG